MTTRERNGFIVLLVFIAVTIIVSMIFRYTTSVPANVEPIQIVKESQKKITSSKRDTVKVKEKGVKKSTKSGKKKQQFKERSPLDEQIED